MCFVLAHMPCVRRVTNTHLFKLFFSHYHTDRLYKDICKCKCSSLPHGGESYGWWGFLCRTLCGAYIVVANNHTHVHIENMQTWETLNLCLGDSGFCSVYTQCFRKRWGAKKWNASKFLLQVWLCDCAYVRAHTLVCLQKMTTNSSIRDSSSHNQFLNELGQSRTGDFPGSYLTLGEVTSLSVETILTETLIARHDILRVSVLVMSLKQSWG